MCVYSFCAGAQNKQFDSLCLLLKNDKPDTAKISHLNSLAFLMYRLNPDSSILLAKEAIELTHYLYQSSDKSLYRSLKKREAESYGNIGIGYWSKGDYTLALQNYNLALKLDEELDNKSGVAKCLGRIGVIHQNQGDYSKALEYYSRALSIDESINNKSGIERHLGNIGIVYHKQGDYPKALEYYFKALKINEEIANKSGIARHLGNIATIYADQGDFEKALTFYHKTLNIDKQIGNKHGISTHLGSIGIIYTDQAEITNDLSDKSELYKKALDYYFQSLTIAEELGAKSLISVWLANIGIVYDDQAEFTSNASEKEELNKKALEYYFKALKIDKELGNKSGMAIRLGNIGSLYTDIKKYSEAEYYLLEALKLDKEIGDINTERQVEELLTELYNKTNRYQLALEHYKNAVLLKDSLFNEEKNSELTRKEMTYEFEKKQTALKREQEIKETIKQEEIKRERIIYWSASGIVSLSLISSLLLFNRKRLKEKNKFQQQLNKQQKEQAIAVMETQEMERKRIAEDLHDSLGHLLSTAKLNLQTLPQEKQVQNSLTLLNQASEEIRNITFNLMPHTLEEDGLIPALEELSNKVSNTGIVRVNLQIHNMEKFQLEKQSQFNIYRIVQEAVNNILKHAGASEISIQVIGQEDHITIMIEDDGKGFNPQTHKTGRGLKNIVTRSLWLKGNINIDSTPGKGTTITTEFPV